MHVLITTPYRLDKNLGKAYNDFMRLLPDDYWGCLIDWDVQFLTHDAGRILHEYAERFPDAGLLTCFTNRKSDLHKEQLLFGEVSENTDYKFHVERAMAQKQHLYEGTVIQKDISGFLMMISKKTWDKFPFDETGKCIGVDTYYGRKLRAGGKEILLMRGIYVWHGYRIMNGVKDKSHLQ